MPLSDLLTDYFKAMSVREMKQEIASLRKKLREAERSAKRRGREKSGKAADLGPMWEAIDRTARMSDTERKAFVEEMFRPRVDPTFFEERQAPHSGHKRWKKWYVAGYSIAIPTFLILVVFPLAGGFRLLDQLGIPSMTGLIAVFCAMGLALILVLMGSLLEHLDKRR